VLREVFGFAGFRGLQRAAVERVLAGGHLLLILPTGGGKSLCYQLPALLLDGLTVVVSPLIALMKDQVDGLRAKGVDAVCLNSSQSRAEREAVMRGLAEGRHRLLYATPERFRKPAFLEALAGRRAALLAVDEAHCISEWGHDFRPDYTRLREIRARLGDPVTLALTATATPETQADVRRQLGLDEAEMPLLHGGVERPNLALEVRRPYGEGGKLAELRGLLGDARGSTIVYFAPIRTLERFSELLDRAGTRHVTYHGRLPAARRRAVQEAFMAGREPLVLATNAFGLGVDKADIGLIVHAELPGSLEAYAQEIGRAGRDGLPARCALLYDGDDLLVQMEFVEWANPAPAFLERLLGLLRTRFDAARAHGLEFLREQLVYKNRGDFRLETALNLLERHGVVEGDLERGDFALLAEELPEALADEALREAKKKRDLTRLHGVARYAAHEGCRRGFLEGHFGFPGSRPCGICDACREEG